MTDMTQLTDFLLARITEDEVVAQRATPGPWRVDEANAFLDGYDVVSDLGDRIGAGVAVDHSRTDREGASSLSNAKHITNWQPTRTLAECKAKRRIVASALDRMGQYEGNEQDMYSAGSRDVSIRHLRLLAEAYEDHPDYKNRWTLKG